MQYEQAAVDVRRSAFVRPQLLAWVLAAVILYAGLVAAGGEADSQRQPDPSERQLNERTWWFGNTWGGGTGPQAKWMQLGVNDFAISGDRIFTICLWDEHGSEAGVYTTDGDKVMCLNGWHSWGRLGGDAVATDGEFVFLSMGHNPSDGGGEDYSGVARYTVDGKPAGWPGAKGGNPACHLAVNADKPSFGAPKAEGYPRNHPHGPFIWSDKNGDGDMQADEYIDAPAGSQALMMDANGDIWVNTGGWGANEGSITRIPFAGLTKQGVPTWDTARATSIPIPADTGIQYLSKLAYDAANDRMYLGVWTKAHPFPDGGWEQMSVGPVVQRFDQWSVAPKLAWERDVRVKDLRSEKEDRTAVAKAWAFEDEHLFIAYTRKFDQEAVDVYRTRDGQRLGMLLPTDDIGSSTGWVDMNDAVQTHRRADGTYVIFLEEVWMEKNLYYLWKPGASER